MEELLAVFNEWAVIEKPYRRAIMEQLTAARQRLELAELDWFNTQCETQGMRDYYAKKWRKQDRDAFKQAKRAVEELESEIANAEG